MEIVVSIVLSLWQRIVNEIETLVIIILEEMIGVRLFMFKEIVFWWLGIITNVIF